jgi:hypothetical protein
MKFKREKNTRESEKATVNIKVRQRRMQESKYDDQTRAELFVI